ncbi:MAG: hypothetical protein WEC80_01845, partial [Patescibacteria group bacterium]
MLTHKCLNKIFSKQKITAYIVIVFLILPLVLKVLITPIPANAAVSFQRAASATGTSVTVDIGEAGNNRLVVAVIGNEATYGDTFQGTFSVDGKNFTQAAVADNPDGVGNHLEVHTIDEAALGSSNGSLSVSYSSSLSPTPAIRVAVYYGIKDDTLIDSEKEDVVIGTPV